MTTPIPPQPFELATAIELLNQGKFKEAGEHFDPLLQDPTLTIEDRLELLHAHGICLSHQGQRGAFDKLRNFIVQLLVINPTNKSLLELLQRYEELPTKTQLSTRDICLREPQHIDSQVSGPVLDGTKGTDEFFQVTGDHKAPSLWIMNEPFLVGLEGHLIDNSGSIILDGSPWDDTGGKLRWLTGHYLNPDLPQQLKGDYLNLNGRWSQNFWHFFNDQLYKLLIAEIMGFQGSVFIPPGASFIPEILEILEVSKERQIIWSGRATCVERLWVPNLINCHSIAEYPGILRAQRKRFFHALQIQETKIDGKRIVIDRGPHATGRRVVNRESLKEVTDAYGFEWVLLESMSVKEQILKLSGAECILAVHGAGLTHSLFAARDAVILEIIPRCFGFPTALPTHRALGQRFYIVNGEPRFPDGEDINTSPTHAQKADVVVDIQMINITLERELGDGVFRRGTGTRFG